MEKSVIIILGILISSLLIILTVIFICRTRMRRVLESLDAMLERAMKGTFTETTFDESLLSAVETKMAHYLAATAASSKNLAAEKDSIQQLISDISHQTKTPVANILLYSELLSEQTLTKEGEMCVKALTKQAEKLQFLMVALVKASRLEAGIITLHLQKGKIQELVDTVVMESLAKAKEKEITIHTRIEDGFAYYDPKWTAEAMYNVLDNAVKYSPKKSTITISAIAYPMFFRVDITDQGIGVAEEEQEKIFTRFYRSTRVSEQEGVGLGLYLAREIISAGGGYIKVLTGSKEGTTFSIFLPTESR